MSEILKKDLEELREAYLELSEKLHSLEASTHKACASAKEWSWVQSKVDKLENRFNDHEKLILPRFDTELADLANNPESKFRKTLKEIMQHEVWYKEQSDEPDLGIYMPLVTTMEEARGKKKKVIEELKKELEELRAAHIELADKFNSLSDDYRHLVQEFNDHVDPIKLQPRFDEHVIEALKNEKIVLELHTLLNQCKKESDFFYRSTPTYDSQMVRSKEELDSLVIDPEFRKYPVNQSSGYVEKAAIALGGQYDVYEKKKQAEDELEKAIELVLEDFSTQAGHCDVKTSGARSNNLNEVFIQWKERR